MWAALAVAVLAASCGGSSGGGNPDGNHPGEAGGKHDAATDVGQFDFPCGGSDACQLNQVCCTMPGPPLTFGCVAPASCPAPDQLLCDGPDECGGATPICCGVEVPNGTGSFPNCGQTSVGTSCTSAAQCPTNLSQSCNQTSKVKICHVKADCSSDPQNDQCCTFASGAASLTFCIDSVTASLGGGVCHN
jgi:hypothetical protein